MPGVQIAGRIGGYELHHDPLTVPAVGAAPLTAGSQHGRDDRLQGIVLHEDIQETRSGNFQFFRVHAVCRKDRRDLLGCLTRLETGPSGQFHGTVGGVVAVCLVTGKTQFDITGCHRQFQRRRRGPGKLFFQLIFNSAHL